MLTECYVNGLKFIPKKMALSRCIFAASLIYCSIWICLTTYKSYSHDINGHLSYIKHLSYNSLNPYTYTGRESWNPPLYYYLAAFTLKIQDLLEIKNPYILLRLLSLFLYSTFIWFSLKTFRFWVKEGGLAYYTGVILIAFWPSSVFIAGRINNDVCLYAIWSMMFYYLSKAYKLSDLNSLSTAIIMAGLALMVKSNAIVPLAVLTGSLAFMAYSLNIRKFLNRKLFIAGLVLAAGFLVNLGRSVYSFFDDSASRIHNHFGEASSSYISLEYFLRFDLPEFISRPFISHSELWQNLKISYLNFLFRTSIYGEFTWGFEKFASFINITYLIFIYSLIATAIAASFIKRKTQILELAPVYLGIILPVIASMCFYYIKQMSACQDFRYLLPMVTPVAILYSKSMQTIGRAGRFPVMPMAVIGLALPVLGVIFYILQIFFR